MDHELAFASIGELHQKYRNKEVSPVEVTQLFIERIESEDIKLNSFLESSFDSALKQAKIAEKEIESEINKGLLHGIPVAVKDLEFTKGIRTTAGSLLYKDRIPTTDSIVVQRIKQSGAIILGKTNTPEFGLLGETRNRLGDHCRNPWDLTKTAGGSSGGSAAAVVAGFCTVATGSDAGGSIRIPASFTGSYGIKPTQGRVPRPAISPPYSSHTAQSGPITRTVRDSAILLQVMAGHDNTDIFSINEEVPDLISASESGSRMDIGKLKVGWSADFGYVNVDPEVKIICEAAFNKFALLGCELSESGFSIEDPFISWFTLFGTGSFGANGENWEERSEYMADYTKQTYKIAEKLTASDFSKAVGNIRVIRQKLEKEFQDLDLIISPTAPIAAYDCGLPPRILSGHDLDDSWPNLSFTYPINSAGYPAASIPAGYTSKGLPVGLHIIGKYGSEATIVKASAAYEQVNPWRGYKPPIS
ncbi:MAG: amidase [Dehalococcoidia bacterium]